MALWFTFYIFKYRRNGIYSGYDGYRRWIMKNYNLWTITYIASKNEWTEWPNTVNKDKEETVSIFRFKIFQTQKTNSVSTIIFEVYTSALQINGLFNNLKSISSLSKHFLYLGLLSLILESLLV